MIDVCCWWVFWERGFCYTPWMAFVPGQILMLNGNYGMVRWYMGMSGNYWALYMAWLRDGFT